MKLIFTFSAKSTLMQRGRAFLMLIENNSDSAACSQRFESGRKGFDKEKYALSAALLHC